MVLVNLTSECIECREKGGCPMVIIHRFTELQRLICRFPLEQCKDHSFLQRLYPRSKQNQDITSLHSPSHPQSTITSSNSHCSQLGSTAKSKTRKRSNNFLGICSYFDLLSCCGKRGGEKEEKSGKEGATNGTPSFGQGIHARWSAKGNEKKFSQKNKRIGEVTTSRKHTPSYPIRCLPPNDFRNEPFAFTQNFGPCAKLCQKTWR